MQLSTLLAQMGGRGGHGGFLLFGILVPLVILGLVAYGVSELVKSRRLAPVAIAAGPPAVFTTSPTALALLDERFARGEIDAEDFVQRRHLLTNPAAPAAATAPATASEVPPEPPATTEQPVTTDPEAPTS